MNEMLNKKDVLDAIEKKMKVVNEADGDADVVLGLAAAMSTVKQMQAAPVNPAEKVGQWITVDKGLMVTSYKCSECGRIVRDDTGYDVTKDYPYCHCGAKMQEVKE